jgi:hypothetical protein
VTRIRAALGYTAELAGRAVVRLPGFAALGCAVAGTWLLAGLGWSLIVAAGFLLLVDRRMP